MVLTATTSTKQSVQKGQWRRNGVQSAIEYYLVPLQGKNLEPELYLKVSEGFQPKTLIKHRVLGPEIFGQWQNFDFLKSKLIYWVNSPALFLENINQNKVYRLVRQHSPPPSTLCAQLYYKPKFYCQYMPILLCLVWLLVIVHQHNYQGCQEISGTEDIRYIKIQLSFEPSLQP